jgi:glycosyltransferase involved in cell wall biosynthesis
LIGYQYFFGVAMLSMNTTADRKTFAFFAEYKTFSFDALGGLESIARRLARGLIRKGVPASFVFFGAPHNARRTTYCGIEICEFQRFSDSLRWIKQSCKYQMTFYLRPNYRPFFLLFARHNASTLRQYYYSTVWNKNKGARFLRRLEAMAMPSNTIFYSASERLQEEMQRATVRTELLLPPVPDDFFQECKSTADGLPKVAFLGRIDPRKGADFAHRVFKQLADIGFQVIIYGYPWKQNAASVHLHEALKAQTQVRFVGAAHTSYTHQTDLLLKNIYSTTDILFLPYSDLSSTVDSPLVVLEGMAHGCAIVARKNPHLQSLYGSGAWMLDPSAEPNDAVAMIQRLSLVLDEEKRRVRERVRVLDYSAASSIKEMADTNPDLMLSSDD